jgi:sporulation integral membrane protein YtvI
MFKYVIWLRLAVAVAALYLLSRVTPIYLPIIVAIVLSFILNPMVNFADGLRLWPTGYRLSRTWAVALSILTAIVMLGGMMVFIFTPFVAEFNRFVVNLPALIQKIQSLTGVLQERANALELPGNVQSLIDQVLSSAAAYAVDLGKRVLTSTVGFASQVVELVVVPVLTYYFLKDWRDLRDSFVTVFPPEGRVKACVVVAEMAEVVSGYIRGQAILSVIIGALVFSGMYFLGVDYPLVLGLLATLTETIPIIGPIIGAAPAIFLAYLLSPALAVKVIIFFLVIHQIENHILVPKVMGRSIDLHPVTVIIALLIGGQLYGVVGMMLAVPVVALLKVLFRQLWQYE